MDNFRKIIPDFITALTTTFPEKTDQWSEWTQESWDAEALFAYCVETYPPHFMDILTKRLQIFASSESVCFLPGVDFCPLFQDEGLSESSKDALWCHLQMILFSILGSVQEKGLFQNDEMLQQADLLPLLTETIRNLGKSFVDPETETETETDETETEDCPDASAPEMPNPDEIHEHLKSLFDSKLGNLAKELVEELLADLKQILGVVDFDQVKSTQDVLKSLLRNPTKIQAIVQLVSTKLQSKLNSGEISQEELLQEAERVFSSFKGFERFAKHGKMKQMFALLSKLGSLFGGAAKSGEDPAANGDLSSLMKEFAGWSGSASESGLGGMEDVLGNLFGGGGGAGMDPLKPQVVYQGQGIRSGNQIISQTMREKMKSRILKKKETQALALAVAQQALEQKQAHAQIHPPTPEDDDALIAALGDVSQSSSNSKKPKNKGKGKR